MLFNSYEFIIVFLPVTIIIYFLLGRLKTIQYAILWLVLASLFFYGWWNPSYLILICTSVIINFGIGVRITGYKNLKKTHLATINLYFGVLFNLLLLGYYKYSNFFIETINNTVGVDWDFYNVILPIGISFFTFQQIAYLIDTRDSGTSEHNFLHYSLFVVFFPQLIAGPIVHHKQMLPQFSDSATYRPSYSNLSVGMSIFAIGLFKKVIIADNLALIATPVFDAAASGNSINFFPAWSATIAYSLQLYFDFSGYSDMAIGLARMFGIKLPINFYSPYKAINIIDFWKRWHMTLSSFLRSYVYIPLGGNRKGVKRRYLNLMLTMLIGSLWHGAAWTFVAWGGLHGLYIVINLLWRKYRRNSINKWWSILIAQSFTFLIVSLAWVLFRADTFNSAIEIYKGMLNLPITLIDEIRLTEVINLGYLFVILIVILVVPNTQQLMSSFNPAYDYDEMKVKLKDRTVSFIKKYMTWSPVFVWSLFISMLFIVSFLNLSHVSEFLYFQF